MRKLISKKNSKKKKLNSNEEVTARNENTKTIKDLNYSLMIEHNYQNVTVLSQLTSQVQNYT